MMFLYSSSNLHQTADAMKTFDLEAYLNNKRERIDSALDAQMPGDNVRPAILHKAMRYSVFSGGKRLRPILCLASAEAVGAPPEAALPQALAVEILHVGEVW